MADTSCIKVTKQCQLQHILRNELKLISILSKSFYNAKSSVLKSMLSLFFGRRVAAHRFPPLVYFSTFFFFFEPFPYCPAQPQLN